METCLRTEPYLAKLVVIETGLENLVKVARILVAITFLDPELRVDVPIRLIIIDESLRLLEILH